MKNQFYCVLKIPPNTGPNELWMENKNKQYYNVMYNACEFPNTGKSIGKRLFSHWIYSIAFHSYWFTAIRQPFYVAYPNDQRNRRKNNNYR